jgi:hypothetical protein
MAMVQCKECGKQMSDTASKCPNCGKARTNRAAVFGLGLGAIILVIVLFYVLTGQFSL